MSMFQKMIIDVSKNINTILAGIEIAVMAIRIAIAGYKVLLGGQDGMEEVKGTIRTLLLSSLLCLFAGTLISAFVGSTTMTGQVPYSVTANDFKIS